MILTSTIIILAFAPGVFFIWFFYKRDRLKPEPKILVLKMFFYGILIAIPAAFVEQFVSFTRYISIIISAPVIEELFKFLVVRFTVYRDREFDEPVDGIIYAAAVALGFASIENLGYLIDAYRSGNLVQVTILRAFLAVPGHALFSSMWGYALGISKFTPGKPTRIIYRGLLLAMLLHAIYNFFALGIPLISLGMIGLTIFMWILVNKRIKILLTKSETKIEEDEGT